VPMTRKATMASTQPPMKTAADTGPSKRAKARGSAGVGMLRYDRIRLESIIAPSRLAD
jgi:hypothetical protein